MLKQKLLAGSLAMLMCFSAALGMVPALPVEAKTAPTGMNSFHYEQLTDTAKAIYDGIYSMYEADLLKTGTADYDLRENGNLSGEACEMLAKDAAALNEAMSAARYAFYADYPEVFYVNFPKLTIRVTKDETGATHLYLGSGRNASYLVDGFADEAQVDAAKTEFDAGIKRITDKAAEAETDVEKLRIVHDEIVNNASYRLEDTCFEGNTEKPGNASHLGSPYGILVRKQGVCEGYARAFKAVLDELGIHSILVQGAHRYDSEVAVAHMWNYVELKDTDTARSVGSKWYAVDLTQDDPDTVISPEKELSDYTRHFDTYGKSGFENEKYFLAGQLTLNGKHFANENVEAAGGYRFAYPLLEDLDYGIRDVVNTMDGFSVKQKTVTGAHDLPVTEFQISYKGMNVTTARENGIYIMARYYDENEETGLVEPVSGWAYFAEDYALKEDETSVYLQEGEVPYMEFAATNVKPQGEFPANLTYAGDDFGIIARTGKIFNENQNGYVAPPYVLRTTPSQSSTIAITDRPYHIVLEYHESLKMLEGQTPGIDIRCESMIGEAVTGEQYSKINNVTFDGNKTVEFDVTFSQMFADNSIIYKFYPTGLVGVDSEKSPNPGVYIAGSSRTECMSIQAQRGSWNLYGKPTLMEEQDLSLSGWKTTAGKEVSDKLSHRLALVVSEPTASQETDLENVMDEAMPGERDKMLSSSTYNIAITICNKNFMKTGHKVKLKVGFPEGYGPEDEGVTFKAYHFMRNEKNEVTGVEEIDCVVTPYGLIITCDAFSPFTIAAVEKEADAPTERSAVVTSSEGGTITGADAGIVKLSEGSRSLTVTADEGYEIESVTVLGETVPVTDKREMTVSVDYDKIGANTIVHANFTAKAVVEKEEERGETPVIDTAAPVEITLPASLTVEGAFDLNAEVAETEGIHTYQWLKDGEPLAGENTASLHVETPEEGTHEYTLSVHTVVGTASADAQKSCSVTYSGNCEHADTTEVAEVPSTCTTKGTAAHTICQACGAVVAGSKEELPLAPHTAVEVVEDAYKVFDANCENKAVYKKSCSVCKEALEETFEYGEPSGEHKAVEKAEDAYKVSDADCKNKAVYKKSCEICGTALEETFEYGELSDAHKAVEKAEDAYKVSDADCKNKAVYKKSCEICGTALEETFEYGELSDTHKLKELVDEKYLVKASTCTEKAVYKKSCEICGKASEETFEYGEINGSHVLIEDPKKECLVSEADCEHKAVYKKSCTCGFISDETFEYGEPTPHTPAEIVEDAYKVSDATCGQKAVYKKSCSVCKAALEETFETGELLPHTPVEAVADEYKVSDADCEHKAVYKKSCSVCKKALEETFETGEATKNHTPAEVVKDEYKVSDADCKHKAVYKKSCSVCKKALDETFETGETKAHTPVEAVKAEYKVSDADCKHKAVYKKSCSVCKEALKETFETGEVSKEHSKETVKKNEKKATCTEDGYTGDTHCKICDAKLESGSAVKATGHKLVKVDRKAADHKADGKKAHYACETCKALFLDKDGKKPVEEKDLVIKKVDHKYVDASDPTHHWKTCACGDTTEKEEHSFGEWKIITKATKDAKGEKERTCSVCKYKETKKVTLEEEASKTTNTKTETKTADKGTNEKGTETVKTGENNFLIISMMGLILFSGCGYVFLAKTKKGRLLLKRLAEIFARD